MSIFANVTILSTGMGLAFPAVSITALSNATDYMRLDENEFSWFGEYLHCDWRFFHVMKFDSCKYAPIYMFARNHCLSCGSLLKVEIYIQGNLAMKTDMRDIDLN